MGAENRIGEEVEAQRSLLETGGDDGSSSKKDLLLPHTAADIVSFFFFNYNDNNNPLSLSLRFSAPTPDREQPNKKISNPD